jgi:prevent-host-death family protein
MYMHNEEVYGIRELQRQLSRALRSVREGRRLVVTDRGRPVAVILASSREVGPTDPEERKISRLHRRGLIVQLGRLGTRRKLPVWRLGAKWVRDFVGARR